MNILAVNILRKVINIQVEFAILDMLILYNNNIKGGGAPGGPPPAPGPPPPPPSGKRSSPQAHHLLHVSEQLVRRGGGWGVGWGGRGGAHVENVRPRSGRRRGNVEIFEKFKKNPPPLTY